MVKTTQNEAAQKRVQLVDEGALLGALFQSGCFSHNAQADWSLGEAQTRGVRLRTSDAPDPGRI